MSTPKKLSKPKIPRKVVKPKRKRLPAAQRKRLTQLIKQRDIAGDKWIAARDYERHLGQIYYSKILAVREYESIIGLN